MFLFAKLIIGSGIGVLMTTCQTYVSEISPLKLRGAFLAVFAFATSIGQLIAITTVIAVVVV